MTKSEALLKLTQRQRDLLRLRDDERLTFREVGERLELSTGYATKLYYTAKVGLEKLMTQTDSTYNRIAWNPVTDENVTATPWMPTTPDASMPEVPLTPAPKPTVVIARGQPRKVVIAHGVIVNTQPAPQKRWPVSVTIRS